MIENDVVGGGETLCSGARTVLVGVKLDAQSKELLTWALVKVAQPGDAVIALHVLGNEIVDREGKSSLLSLVKTFDSVLAVYEGFCNLKQVDLKLKLCRGSSTRKILVREAISCSASTVIVGTARTHHRIRSSTSTAKYCAKKLSKDCWILAVDNGKISFQREGSPSITNYSPKGKEAFRRNSLFSVLHQTISLTKNTKVVSDANEITKGSHENAECQSLEQALAKARLDFPAHVVKQNCSVCGSFNLLLDASHENSKDKCSTNDNDDSKSMAIVPVPKVETSSSSVTTLVRQIPEVRPGWPLLRRAAFIDRPLIPRSSLTHISVVQWALRLPSRNRSLVSISEHEHIGYDRREENSPGLDGYSGAIVPVVNEFVITEYETRNLPKELERLHEKYSATCRLFKYQELVSATSNFSEDNLVGRGGSSRVFKGYLPDGKEIAVKILKKTEDVLKEFLLEIEIITALHHKNIISLFGFCFEDNNLLLVYDFLARGSLEENLHGNKKDPLAFCWSERYKVAVGVAEALEYLHNRSTQSVIHRDVKSSNILLYDDFEPQLSDFGLAKWSSDSSMHITCTDVVGTFGYLAPEYFMYGKVNDKIDVYAFGVVLLELLSGRKPIASDYPTGQESLAMWATPILDDGKFLQLLDPNFGENFDHDQVERMALAAGLCIRRSPHSRPPMSLVLKILEGDADALKWVKHERNGSKEFDTWTDELCTQSDLRSHLNLALHDVEDDSLSMGSVEQSVPWEDYLRGRCSRSSSFD